MNGGSPQRPLPQAPAERLAALAVAATLVTLPWVGCGVVHLLAGIDVGTGIQPAYLGIALLAVAASRRGGIAGVLAAQPGWWRRWWVLALVAILVSGLGLVRCPAPAVPAAQWARFGRQVLQWLLLAAYPLLLVWWLRGERRWRLVERALLAGLAFQLLYAACQLVAFRHPFPGWTFLERIFTSNPGILCGSEELYLGRHFSGIPRLRGTACEPLYLGNYLLLLLPWSVAAAAGDRRRLWAPVGAAVLLLGTWSRGAWLAALPLLVAGVVLARRAGLRPTTGGRRLVPAAAILVAGGAVAVVAGGHGDWLLLPWRRLLQSLSREDWSNLTRLYSHQAAWRMFRHCPVWGVGWGQFGYQFPWFVDLRGLQSQFTWPVVNDYPLRILAETGLLGAGGFAAAVAATARRVWQAADRLTGAGLPPVTRRRLVAATAAVCGVWAQLLTFSQVNLPHIWVALGLLIAAWRDAASAPRGEGTP